MVKVDYDEKKKKWIELPPRDKRGLYLDGFLKKKLDNVKSIQKKNWDCCFIIVGTEGVGKSTLSFVCGQYLADNKLSMKNICNGGEDAIKKLKELPDKSVLILDEAELLFSSRETMKREQKHITHVLMTIRQKNMVLILVAPSFHDLSKYVAVHRSRFVIRCYSDKKLNRGRFAFWGEKRKRILYELGKKNFGSYSKPKADFFGSFNDYTLPFDNEYQKGKTKALQEAMEPPKKEERVDNKWLHQRNYALKLLYEKYGLSQREIADFFVKNGQKMTREAVSMAIGGLKVNL